MGVNGGEFLVEKFEGLEIWPQKFEVPNAMPLGGPTPQGASRPGHSGPGGPGQATGHAGQPSRAKGSGALAYLHG